MQSLILLRRGASASRAWAAAGAAGHEVAYWRQDESGRWRKEG